MDSQTEFQFTIILVSYEIDSIIYQMDFAKRQQFLYSLQNQQWQKGLEDALDIPVCIAKFETSRQFLSLTKSNSNAKNFYNINTDIEFKSFCRNFQIAKLLNSSDNDEPMNILQFILKQREKKKKSIMNLEVLIYQMLQKPKRFHRSFKVNQSIYHTNFNLIGYYRKQLMQVKFFIMYGNHPTIIFLFEKEENEEQIWKYKATQKTNNLIFQKIIKVNKDLQRNALIGVRGLLKYQKGDEPTKFSRILQSIQCYEYQVYNNMINIGLFKNFQFYPSMNSLIQIKELKKNIFSILRPLLNARRVKMVWKDCQEDFVIFSCQWKLQQILLNLLYNSIRNSDQKDLILVRLKQKKKSIFGSKLVKIRISDRGKNISQKIIDCLPIMNPYYLWEYYINQQNEKQQLGLTIASYLIGQIGPTAQLSIKQKDDLNKFEFKIYQNADKLVKQSLIKCQKFQGQIRIKGGDQKE